MKTHVSPFKGDRGAMTAVAFVTLNVLITLGYLLQNFCHYDLIMWGLASVAAVTFGANLVVSELYWRRGVRHCTEWYERGSLTVSIAMVAIPMLLGEALPRTITKPFASVLLVLLPLAFVNFIIGNRWVTLGRRLCEAEAHSQKPVHTPDRQS